MIIWGPVRSRRRPISTGYRLFRANPSEGPLLPRRIPAREALVWDNPELLASLKRGREQVALGKLDDRGSFAQHVDEDDDPDA